MSLKSFITKVSDNRAKNKLKLAQAAKLRAEAKSIKRDAKTRQITARNTEYYKTKRFKSAMNAITRGVAASAAASTARSYNDVSTPWNRIINSDEEPIVNQGTSENQTPSVNSLRE